MGAGLGPDDGWHGEWSRAKIVPEWSGCIDICLVTIPKSETRLGRQRAGSRIKVIHLLLLYICPCSEAYPP